MKVVNYRRRKTANFRGVKNLDPILKRTTSELSDKEVFDKILGIYYEQPICPECRTKLRMTSLNSESLGSSWNTTPTSLAVHVEMRCTSCGTIIKAIVVGWGVEGEDFYFETLTVNSIIKGTCNRMKEHE